MTEHRGHDSDAYNKSQMKCGLCGDTVPDLASHLQKSHGNDRDN